VSSFPEVRALCRRARRPTIRIAIAAAMIAPAGAFMARAQVAGWNEEPVEAVEEPVQEQARDAVAQAWRERALEREREKLSAQFAELFEIPFDLAHQIHGAALEEKIDPALAFRLVRAESSFRPMAVSPVGALGLTQLMPSTARWLEPGTTRTQLLEPRTNLRVGFRYLRQLLDRYEGDERLALTAYNRGPGTVNSLLRRGRDPGNGYAELVLTGRSEKHVSLMNAKFGRKRTKRS
jgi:soluble lytic murein transglycosylase-like protein